MIIKEQKDFSDTLYMSHEWHDVEGDYKRTIYETGCLDYSPFFDTGKNGLSYMNRRNTFIDYAYLDFHDLFFDRHPWRI